MIVSTLRRTFIILCSAEGKCKTYKYFVLSDCVTLVSILICFVYLVKCMKWNFLFTHLNISVYIFRINNGL